MSKTVTTTTTATDTTAEIIGTLSKPNGNTVTFHADPAIFRHMQTAIKNAHDLARPIKRSEDSLDADFFRCYTNAVERAQITGCILFALTAGNFAKDRSGEPQKAIKSAEKDFSDRLKDVLAMFGTATTTDGKDVKPRFFQSDLYTLAGLTVKTGKVNATTEAEEAFLRKLTADSAYKKTCAILDSLEEDDTAYESAKDSAHDFGVDRDRAKEAYEAICTVPGNRVNAFVPATPGAFRVALETMLFGFYYTACTVSYADWKETLETRKNARKQGTKLANDTEAGKAVAERNKKAAERRRAEKKALLEKAKEQGNK